jgi:hypothetical protein
MTNDESNPNDRKSNDETKASAREVSSFGHSYFEFDSSFVIRVSSFRPGGSSFEFRISAPAARHSSFVITD